MAHKAVFIDRDGVINSDVGHYYIYKPEDVVLNADIPEGLKLLQTAGYKLVIVTNQGGVAKGEYTLEDVQLTNQHIKNLLLQHEITLDAIYVCPHHNAVMDCPCRKPKPGMILQAIRELDIDPGQSFLIGDSSRDIEAGKAAGLKQCYKIDANSSILPACKQLLNQP